MTVDYVDADLRLVIQACLASLETPLGNVLSQLLDDHARTVLGLSQAKGAKKFRAILEEQGGDPLLPLQMSQLDASIALCLAGDSKILQKDRFAAPTTPPSFGRVFSEWSRVDAGFAFLTHNTCEYVVSPSHDLGAQGEHVFSLRPSFRAAYTECILEQTATQPEVKISLNDRLELNFPFTPPAQRGFSTYTGWVLDSSGLPQRVFTWRDADPDSDSINIQLDQPESILQVSAAADQGFWMHVAGEAISVFFRVPDLDDDGASSLLWSNQTVDCDGYIEYGSSSTIPVPTNVASECVRSFWWFALADRQDMYQLLRSID